MVGAALPTNRNVMGKKFNVISGDLNLPSTITKVMKKISLYCVESVQFGEGDRGYGGGSPQT